MIQVCVVGSDCPGKRGLYTQTAKRLGAELGKRGWTVLLVGPLEGLLEATASEAKRCGGSVLGLGTQEPRHLDADAYFILPGGFETLRLVFDLIGNSRLHSPVGVINVTGFYDRFLAFLHTIQAEGFMRAQYSFLVHHQVERVVASVERRLLGEHIPSPALLDTP